MVRWCPSARSLRDIVVVIAKRAAYHQPEDKDTANDRYRYPDLGAVAVAHLASGVGVAVRGFWGFLPQECTSMTVSAMRCLTHP